MRQLILARLVGSINKLSDKGGGNKMLFNIICTILFFVLFLGFFVWLIRISKKGMSKLHSKIVLLIVFGGGWILATASWLIPLVKSWNYVTVDAVITNIEEFQRSGSDTSDTNYRVTFQYTYENTEYNGDMIYQGKRQIPDTHTKVKCNPDNPTELANFSLFWIGVVITVVFGLVDFFLIKDFIYFIKNKGVDEEDPEYDSEIQSD